MINDQLNAFLHIAPTPIQETNTGPLAGMKIAIKDVIATKDMPTTAGSRILNGYISPYDATVVTKLKQAGAILVGKTNCDEFAMGSSGENSAYGPTLNPWDTTRVPGGSSSGSAAAVAAGYVEAALGSDTAGSVRQPAAFCGVVGLKPTYGSVSRYGLIAMSSSLDVIGPFARDVATVEKVYKVIKGKDAMDATSSEMQNAKIKSQNDKSKFKIGVPKEYFVEGMERGVKALADQTVATLQRLGHAIEKVSLPHTSYAMAAYYVLQSIEVASNLARFDGIRFGHDRSYFGKEPMRRIMLGTFTSSTGYVDHYYTKALAVKKLVKEDFDNAFKKVDCIVAPITPTVAFKLGEKSQNPLQMYLSDILTAPANLAGIPAISLPVGLSPEGDALGGGLPVGMQLMGPQFSEPLLFALAKQLEEAVGFNSKFKNQISK